MRILLVRRPPLAIGWRLLLPVWAVLASLAVSAVFILLAGGDVIECYRLIFSGSLGSRFDFYETLLKMTPLCLTGLAVTVAFRAKFWNIGAEGQLFGGAVLAAWLGTVTLSGSPFIDLPVILAGAFVGGGLLAVFPAWLKVRFRADDVVTTLMLNFVVICLVQALLDTLWRDPVSGWPHSPAILGAAHLPRLFPPGRLHLGLIVALAAALLCHLLFRYTRPGFRIRAVWLNPQAAGYGGIGVGRTILTAAFISGGLAGLAGAGEVCGVQFYLVDGISPGYGYFGVAIAMLAALEPLGVILASFFFAVFITGAQTMSQFTGVPVYIADILRGLILIAMMVALLFDKYRLILRKG